LSEVSLLNFLRQYTLFTVCLLYLSNLMEQFPLCLCVSVLSQIRQ
jgi:hypothetical protein